MDNGAINKTMTACNSSGKIAENHFPQMVKMVQFDSSRSMSANDGLLDVVECMYPKDHFEDILKMVGIHGGIAAITGRKLCQKVN